MQHQELKKIIENAWEQRDSLTPKSATVQLKQTVQTVIEALETGSLRAADFSQETGWKVNAWVKQAILLYFKCHDNELIDGGFTQFYDKIPLQFSKHTAADLQQAGSFHL